MLRAHEILEAGHWTGSVCDTVVLDYDARHRRRVLMSGQQGLEFLLDLPKVPSLEEGDALVLDDGRLIAIAAAREPVLEIRASDARQLARLAWHLGNRHLPTQIDEVKLIIRADPVIEEMLRGLGAMVESTSDVFRPEGGAYGHKNKPGGSHDHDFSTGEHHHRS